MAKNDLGQTVQVGDRVRWRVAVLGSQTMRTEERVASVLDTYNDAVCVRVKGVLTWLHGNCWRLEGDVLPSPESPDSGDAPHIVGG